MRELLGKPGFLGIWDEDLKNTIDVFDIFAEMCEVNDSKHL